MLYRLKKVSVEAYVWENYTVNCSQWVMNTHAISAAKAIKNADSNAPFSSATESLGFSNNCFKTAYN